MHTLQARFLELDEQAAKAAIFNLNRVTSKPNELEEGLGQLQACDREPLTNGFSKLRQEAHLLSEATSDFIKELKLP